MRRFLAWFTEIVPMPRGYAYLALGFGILQAINLVAWVL